MQFEDLEHENSGLILRLKAELSLFKSSLNKLIENIEIKFSEIISKFTIPKHYCQQVQNKGEIILDDSLFLGLVQEMNMFKDQQYFQLILNKLRKRIKHWNTQCRKIIDIQTDQILQINEVCSFDRLQQQAQIWQRGNKKVGLGSTESHYCFAFLDKPLNYQRKQSFLFYIHCFTKNVGIGIGNIQKIRDNKFIHNLELEYHEAYLCLADKSIRHHTKLAINRKQLGISMKNGDVIKLTFNPYNNYIEITWKNLNNKQEFRTVIDNLNEELRPCVAMRYKDTIVFTCDDEPMIE